MDFLSKLGNGWSQPSHQRGWDFMVLRHSSAAHMDGE